LTSQGWVNPVPDPLLLRKSGSAGNRTRDLCICSQKLWPLDHRGGPNGSLVTFFQSDVKLLCNINSSTSVSHFTSAHPRRRVPPADQVIIRLCHLPCSIRTKCPYHFNALFSILYKILLLQFFPKLRHLLLSKSGSPCCFSPNLHSCT